MADDEQPKRFIGRDWTEQASYTWEMEPGDTVSECHYCGPFWRASVERDSDARFGLVLREWHTHDCPVIAEVPPSEPESEA